MTLYELTKSLVKDDSGKLSDPFDYDSGISAALKRYGKHRPRLAAADLPGDGSNDLALPSDWSPGFSAIASIEYPVGLVPANLLAGDLFTLYQSPTGQKLRILHTTIDAAETVRCGYTILHSEESLPSADQEAVANLAASFCLRQLAAAFGQTGDSTIQADSVNYRSKADEFRRLADSFESLYKGHLGIRDSDTVAAGMTTAPPPERTRAPWSPRR